MKPARTKKSNKSKPTTPAREPLPKGAVLLSVDASSTAVGWSVWNGTMFLAASIIDSKANTGDLKRMFGHSAALEEVVEKYKIDVAVMEWQSHKVSTIRGKDGQRYAPQGLAKLGQAQGVLIAMLVRRLGRDRVETVGEQEWVSHFTGTNAKKATRAEYVKLAVPAYARCVATNPKWDVGLDVCDALGIALFRLGIRVDLKST